MTNDLETLLRRGIDPVIAWQATYGSEPPHPSLVGGQAVGGIEPEQALDELGERLRDNFPFQHPRYAGQMLKPPHPVAVAAYTATMLINPNNHALDGGPATAALEKEVVADLAEMFGLVQHLGHLTSSGTIANLEALFIARETHPGQSVVWSQEAHYTHARMCHALGIEGRSVAADAAGRMDLDALEDTLSQGGVGTIVATLGTTALGAVDPVHEIVALAKEYGCRVHVDAAYGGFFTLIAGESDGIVREPFDAVGQADSVVVDPHKHGLQPYGCGAVLFADPAVGRHYAHDSPYTYFTSDELHLGEISLECSRAGAAAAALWTTLRVLPLTAQGLGAVLRPGVRAARRWSELVDGDDALTTYQEPQLDIVTYFPSAAGLSVVDRVSGRVMDELMTDEDPVFLATLAVTASAMRARHRDLETDLPAGKVLRSVLMKPEHEGWVERLHERVATSTRHLMAQP